MSRVTNVVITTGPSDWSDEADAGIHAVQTWLEANGHPKLAEISDKAAGRKAFEVELWAGAYNWIDEEGLVSTIRTAPWRTPDEVAVIVIRQEGQPLVFSP